MLVSFYNILHGKCQIGGGGGGESKAPNKVKKKHSKSKNKNILQTFLFLHTTDI